MLGKVLSAKCTVLPRRAKPRPVIVTVVPTGPNAGSSDRICSEAALLEDSALQTHRPSVQTGDKPSRQRMMFASLHTGCVLIAEEDEADLHVHIPSTHAGRMVRTQRSVFGPHDAAPCKEEDELVDE